jgi:hypothetical protein
MEEDGGLSRFRVGREPVGDAGWSVDDVVADFLKSS